MRTRRLAAVVGGAALTAAAVLNPPWASARPVLSHGSVVSVAGTSANATHAPMTSNNWFGYNQGSLASGGKTFHSISATWTVPTASQHTKGQAEFSSSWIGIGGGCVDSGCVTTDSTLIQAGTEQDVDASGQASYSAWWEVIPAPSVTFTNVAVAAGDPITVSIAETAPEVWSIKLTDGRTGAVGSMTVPYSSSYLTAEWIEETPVVLSTSTPGLAPLPNLSTVDFDHATVNGAPAGLSTSQEMVLLDSSNQVIGAPSDPDTLADGFGACAWSTTCSPPPSS